MLQAMTLRDINGIRLMCLSPTLQRAFHAANQRTWVGGYPGSVHDNAHEAMLDCLEIAARYERENEQLKNELKERDRTIARLRCLP